jgi:arylsulfatase A-like enzyme
VPGRPNILIYLVDTLRRDHLGVYGYQRPISPRLDAFARTATVFDRAIAQAPWTRPAVASLFTGLLPPQHGVEGRADALAADTTTMAELFGALGYETAAFVTNGNASPGLGFEQGFGHFEMFDEAPDSAEVHQQSDVVTRAVARFLDGRDAGAPLFLYAHTTDPHDPYAPRAEARARFAPGGPERVSLRDAQRLAAERVPPERRQAVIGLYDAEIASNDEQFGALLDDLDRRGWLDEAIVIFTADHGEAFDEHGDWLHGTSLYAEQIDIPLVIRFPGGTWAGERVADPAGQVDVLPTLLHWLGAAVPAGLSGRSLLPRLACPETTRPAVATSHVRIDATEAAAVVTATEKLIRHRRSERTRRAGFELFAVPGDGNESADVAADLPFERGRLAVLLRALEHGGTRIATGGDAIPGDLRDRLRALGYIR